MADTPLSLQQAAAVILLQQNHKTKKYESEKGLDWLLSMVSLSKIRKQNTRTILLQLLLAHGRYSGHAGVCLSNINTVTDRKCRGTVCVCVVDALSVWVITYRVYYNMCYNFETMMDISSRYSELVRSFHSWDARRINCSQASSNRILLLFVSSSLLL